MTTQPEKDTTQNAGQENDCRRGGEPVSSPCKGCINGASAAMNLRQSRRI